MSAELNRKRPMTTMKDFESAYMNDIIEITETENIRGIRINSLLRQVLGMIVIVLTMGLLVGNYAPERDSILEISCPENEACWGLIEDAVARAPKGSILQVRPGTYYESAIIIDKSLTLEGAGPATTRIVFRGQDPDEFLTAIVILANEPITVRISGVQLQANPDIQKEGIKVLSQTVEEAVQVILNDLHVESRIGIAGQALQVGGLKAQGPSITLENSTLAAEVGVNMESGQVFLKGNLIQAAPDTDSWSEELQVSPTGVLLTPGVFLNPPPGTEFPPAVFLPISVEASLKENRIQGFQVGIAMSAHSMLETSLNTQLIENEVAFHEVGVLLMGDQVTANLMRNKIYENRQYGVMLALPGCPFGSTFSNFQGIVQGIHNEIYGNGQNLCPPDYPWPEGFTTP
jgi:hypothetical protein